MNPWAHRLLCRLFGQGLQALHLQPGLLVPLSSSVLWPIHMEVWAGEPEPGVPHFGFCHFEVLVAFVEASYNFCRSGHDTW